MNSPKANPWRRCFGNESRGQASVSQANSKKTADAQPERSPPYPQDSDYLAGLNLIHRPVRRNLRHHEAVGNTQQGITRLTLQMIHQLMDHHIDRRQRLD